MSRQPSSLTPNMLFPTSLLGAKPCFHAFGCIFFFLNALFLFSTFLTLIFLILLCLSSPPPLPGPLVTYTLNFWTFLTRTHLVSFSTYQALIFFFFVIVCRIQPPCSYFKKPGVVNHLPCAATVLLSHPHTPDSPGVEC